jgi:hypothetical protein
MKEEALKLADELASYYDSDYDKAEAMIRRLVEELDKQKEKAKWFEQSWSMLDDVVKKHEAIPSRKEAIDKARAKLKEVGEVFAHYCDNNIRAKTKPLSDEEINEISMKCYVYPADGSMIFNQHKFARAIEERHGIK